MPQNRNILYLKINIITYSWEEKCASKKEVENKVCLSMTH